MIATVGIFQSERDAQRAAAELRSIGIPEDKIEVVRPGESLHGVPSSETEQPGMGGALGGTVGGALGAAGGLTLGTAAASLLLPGIGPIVGGGIIAAALFGVGGAVGGAAAGRAVEDSMDVDEGLTRDEVYLYEDALRQGRTLVIGAAQDEAHANRAREVLARHCVETIDAARESWWLGVRDAESEHYEASGGDFVADEQAYRRGFEAAQNPPHRGKGYEEALASLRKRHGQLCSEPAFRRGFERGQEHFARTRRS